MVVTTTNIALNPAMSLSLRLFPAQGFSGRAAILELAHGADSFDVHFSSVIDPEMLGIAAALDVLDPASTDAAIHRRANVEIRSGSGSVEFTLRVGEYLAECRCRREDIPEDFFA